MSKSKIPFIFAFIMLTSLNFAQHTDQINSNRPGVTMSAFAVGKSVIQVETGIYGIHENHVLLGYDAKGFGADLTLRYGAFMERLEVVIIFTLIMANLLSTKQELHLELEHTKEPVRATT